jgi:ketosteroid isomerase-like protein
MFNCSNSNTKNSNKTKEMEKENKQIVNSFFELVSEGNTTDAFKLIDENVNWWIPGTLPFSGNKTKEEYQQIINAIKTGFPTGFTLTVKSLIAEGNKVATEVESSGNHVNGKAYNNKYHFLFEIENGKIKSVKEYMDTLHLYQLLMP